jgi:hypothetical protein
MAEPVGARRQERDEQLREPSETAELHTPQKTTLINLLSNIATTFFVIYFG